MFKSYRVEGDKVIVELEHAEGGLVVAETGTNSKEGLAVPTVIPDGAKQVKLFYLAGEDRVWCPAEVKIDGEQLVVTSPKVKAPRGVTYGTGGIGNHPNIYNQAMLPLAPFIYYDNELVTAKPGPASSRWTASSRPPAGKLEEYRKMPLLSSQFVNNAVLQAGQPVTIWGSALPMGASGAITRQRARRRSSSALPASRRRFPSRPDMKEWQVTLPPMKASAEPKTLKVTFTIDGELAHERVVTNIVFGDVWYVAAPLWQLRCAGRQVGGRGADDDTQPPKGTGATVHAVTACPLPPRRKTGLLRSGRMRKALRPPWVNASPPRPASRWASSSCRARAARATSRRS